MLLNANIKPTFVSILVTSLLLNISGCEKHDTSNTNTNTNTNTNSNSAVFTIDAVADNQLARTINIAFAEDELLKGLNIKILAKNNNVSLIGIVKDKVQHDQAILLASGIRGIGLIDDQISIGAK